MFNNSSSTMNGNGGGLLPNGNPFLQQVYEEGEDNNYGSTQPVNINTLEGNFNQLNLGSNNNGDTVSGVFPSG